MKGGDMRETIAANEHDDWKCLCNNTAIGHGFYPCDENGNEVEPTEKAWKTNWYVCRQCGRVIDQGTHAVIKRVNPQTIRIVA